MFKNNVTKVKFVNWIKAAGVRAVKTMAQVAGSMLIIGAFNETAWGIMIQATLTAGLASILTSVVGIPEVKVEEE